MSGFSLGAGHRMMAGPRSPRESTESPEVEHLGRRISGLFRDYRRPLTWTFLLILAGAAISTLTPFLTQAAFDRALFPKSGRVDLGLLWWLGAGMVVLPATAALLGIWRTWFTTRIGNNVMADLRGRLFEHLQRMDLAFFTGTRTGAIQSRLSNDVGGVQTVLTDTAASIVSNAITLLAAVIAMFLLSWRLTLVALALLPLLIWMQVRVGARRRRIAARTQESLAEMTAITQESLSVSGIVLTKSFGRQQMETDRYEEANRRQARLQVEQQMAGQWFFGAVGLVVAATPAAIYVTAGYLNTGTSLLSAGTIVAFTTLQARIMQPVVSLLRVSLDVQTSMALFARIFDYLDLRPAIREPANPTPLPRPRGTIEVDDVTFAYPEQDSPALTQVSFTAEAGSLVALVGPSGAGKTTLSYLIPRLYDVGSGAIRIDGVDVRDLSFAELGSTFGIVTQETYLFHDTIRANLLFANPEANDEELAAAARAANIHERIMSFPEGYDTTVGERGYRLSGGEKQRIAIARVLLKDPAVLILDEATAALDTVSERLVQEALERVLRGRTTISIAHRLSTIRHADQILVVDGGRIVESGTHEDLVALGGLYATLDAHQVQA